MSANPELVDFLADPAVVIPAFGLILTAILILLVLARVTAGNQETIRLRRAVEELREELAARER